MQHFNCFSFKSCYLKSFIYVYNMYWVYPTLTPSLQFSLGTPSAYPSPILCSFWLLLFLCLPYSCPLSPTVHGCAVIHWEWQPTSRHIAKKKVILPSPEATSCQWSSARVGALGATCSNFKLFLDVLKLKCNYVVSLLPIFSATPPIYHLLQSLKFMA